MKRPTWTGPAVGWALVVTLLVPIWWGGDGRYPWDNSIAPAAVLKAIAAKFAPGFFMTYGPVPYYLTAVPFVAVLGFAKVVGELGRPTSQYPWGFQHPEFMMSALSTAAHLVTMVLGLLIVWMSLGRAPGAEGRRARWLVPLLFLGSPVFAYYARTSNVDVHYLFWLWVGVTLIERWDGRLSRLMGASASAALALCSKEQAGPAAVVIILAAAWRALRSAPGAIPARLASAFGVGAASLLAYAVAWRLPWNLEGWRVHHDFLFGEAKYARDFPATLEGFAQLAIRVVHQLPLAVGPLALGGIAMALLLRARPKGLGLRSLVVAGYVVGFLGVIGYCYERFLIPLLFLSVPIAARGYEAALDWAGRRPALRVALVAAMLVAALTGGPSVSVVMLTDPRYAVEAWIRERVPESAVIELAGNPHYQARVPATRRLVHTKADSLGRAPRAPLGDVVLLSSIDVFAFEHDAVARRAWLEPLRTGATGHERRVFQASPLARFTRGLEIPSVTVYVRRGLRLRNRS